MENKRKISKALVVKAVAMSWHNKFLRKRNLFDLVTSEGFYARRDKIFEDGAVLSLST